jgi:hypothetical protein
VALDRPLTRGGDVGVDLLARAYAAIDSTRVGTSGKVAA